MQTFVFAPATKAGTFARIGLVGGPGSGKTWTALTIAEALGGTIGVIDSERRSAAKYADVFGFQHLPMTAFDPADLTAATAAAAEQGINVLIVDTWSPFWEGIDGMLEQVDRKTAAAGRSDKFGVGWKEMRPVERRMIDALLAYPGHVIITMRVKVEYIIETDPRTGKQGPKRVGLKPIQRDGVEYEFDVVGDMDNSTLTVTKSRCPALTGAVIDKPTGDLGHTILDWLTADAVGEPLNPLTIRDWAAEPGRTLDELRVKRDEVEAAGIGGAAVNDINGTTFTLVAFITEQARKVRDRTENAAAAAARHAAASRAAERAA